MPNIETAVLGVLQSTETYSYPDNPEYEYWGDQLVSVNGNEIEYDNVGNPIYYYVDCDYTDNCLLFLEWEGRQLVGVEEYTNGEFYYTYEYNDEGIRTSKTLDDIEYKYTLNGSQIVSQEWDNKLIVFFYDESGSPIGYGYRTTSMAADTFYYYIYEKNLQGDIVAIYNTSGTKLVSYTYDAWGNVSVSNHNISGTNAGAQYNPFRYRGYYYDEEVGLYYLNSRYYDPRTGRFLNADVYLNANGDLVGFNMYAYCSNNPIMYCDYSGSFAITISTLIVGIVIGAVLGGTAGLGATMYSDLSDDGELFKGSVGLDEYLGNFVGGFIAGAGIGACNILGAGVGSAIFVGNTLMIGGISVSAGTAFGLASSAALVTGGLGYISRVAINRKETFELSDMIIESGANCISGIASFGGGMFGGMMGINTPGNNSIGKMALNQVGMAFMGIYHIKGYVSQLESLLKEIY